MSEKRKKSDSPLSKKTRLKLKTKRTSSTEENTIDNGETTPKRYNSHSTPIRKSNIINNVDDSPEMCHRASPISNTQKNEVLWSWHSPKDDLKTPKRSAKLQKRRMPDSPKMFALSKIRAKTKGPNLNQAEFIANFEPFRAIMVNQMIAIDKPTEPVPSTSDEIEMKSNEESSILQINETTTPKSKVDKKPLEITNKSDLKLVYHDDYSLDESLVRCSQMCEEEFFAKVAKEQQIGTSTPLMKIEAKGSHIHNSPISGLENLIKIPIETPRKIAQSTPKAKLISIADDSFDEYLSQLKDEDLPKIESPLWRNKSRLNSSAPKKSLFPNTKDYSANKLGIVKSCSTLDTKKPIVNDKFLPKTKSFDLQTKIYPSVSKISAQQQPPPQSNVTMKQVIESSPRKFFKSKCNSEPLVKSPKITSIPINKKFATNTTNLQNQNIPNNGTRITAGKSFQCKIYSDSCYSQNTNSSSGGSNSSSGSNNFKIIPTTENRPINNNINNINNNIHVSNNFPNNQLSTHRSMGEFHNQSKRTTQVILFTEEQIEKKRLEAKMKLAAKRQMLLSTKNPTTTTMSTITPRQTTTVTKVLPIASSIKR